RHQDQRLLALADDLVDRLEVDLRLAAAGDAVQQERLEAALLQRRLEQGPDPALVLVEGDRTGRRGDLLGRVGKAIDAAGGAAGQPLAPRRLDRAGAAADQPRQPLDLDGLAELAQLPEDLALAGGQFRLGAGQFVLGDGLDEGRPARAGTVLGPGRD